jgi:hypothetical protein
MRSQCGARSLDSKLGSEEQLCSDWVDRCLVVLRSLLSLRIFDTHLFWYLPLFGNLSVTMLEWRGVSEETAQHSSIFC